MLQHFVRIRGEQMVSWLTTVSVKSLIVQRNAMLTVKFKVVSKEISFVLPTELMEQEWI